MTTVQCGKNPWLCRVEIDSLDTLRARKELALQFESANVVGDLPRRSLALPSRRAS